MSDYKYVKVIRYRNPLLLGELLPNYIYGANNYQDLIDYIMKTHPEYSENPKYKKFKLGFDRDNDYIDFVLEESYGKKCGEWYHTERLTDEEFKEYQKMFSEFLNIPNEDIKSLCKVDYYWYISYEPTFIAYEEYDYSTDDERNKRITIEIMGVFENKLEELGITLPDDLREGKEDESRIFGKNYYELEDIKLLERNKKK